MVAPVPYLLAASLVAPKAQFLHNQARYPLSTDLVVSNVHLDALVGDSHWETPVRGILPLIVHSGIVLVEGAVDRGIIERAHDVQPIL